MPISTARAAAQNSTLFTSSRVSRDSKANCPPPVPSSGARQAYSHSDTPTTATMKHRMNRPRPGSTANAWTEVSTPERTRNVPSRHSENAQIASSADQLRNAPRWSVTISECSKAVPTSQGMKEAFSTGSQNHHPPQPST